MVDVGMNLAAVEYWSTESPFLDHFKMSGDWTTLLAKDYTTGAPPTLDANGYPTSMPDGAAQLRVAFQIDPPSTGQPHRYVLTYSGTATVDVFGGTLVSSKPGEYVFDFTRTDMPFVILEVTSMDSSNPIHDIHVVRQDQQALYNAGEIFNPTFLQKAASFNTLRYMDWEGTNGSAPVSWNSRATMNSASWSWLNTNHGVPLEVMVALANKTHTNMWYNVPTQADDNYVRQAMTYIRDHLDPTLKVQVEYSNEVWNWGFDAAGYGQSKALAIWGSTDYGHLEYYGYRSAQIASIAKTVFGASADTRVETVLATQAVVPFLSTYLTTGIQAAHLGTVGQLFDDFAITTYFGWTFSSQNPTDVATVLGWANSGEAGMAAAFHELEFGGALTDDSSLTSIMKYWTAQAAFAKANGLNLVAYEGGAHLTATGFAADNVQTVQDFIGRLMNDPRMGVLYTKMINQFAAAGGTLLDAFNDAGGNGISGYWGVLDSIYQSGSPRYDALAAAGAATSGATTAAAIAASGTGTSTTPPTVDLTPFKKANWALLGARSALGVKTTQGVAVALADDPTEAGPVTTDNMTTASSAVSDPLGASVSNIDTSAATLPMTGTLSIAAAAASLANAIASTPAADAGASTSVASAFTPQLVNETAFSGQDAGASPGVTSRYAMMAGVRDLYL